MTSKTAFDAKIRFGKLLEQLASDKKIVITKQDKPAARMVPVRRPGLSAAREAVAEFRELRQRIARRTGSKRGVSVKDFKSAVADGRK